MFASDELIIIVSHREWRDEQLEHFVFYQLSFLVISEVVINFLISNGNLSNYSLLPFYFLFGIVYGNVHTASHDRGLIYSFNLMD